MNPDMTRMIPALLVFVLLAGAVTPVAAAPNGTETIVTTDTSASFQQTPAISGTLIVWDDQRLGTGMNNIYAYNLATGLEYPVLPDTTNPLLWQTAPAVSGDWIVWQQDDLVTYAVLAFNNRTGEIITIPARPLDSGGGSYLFSTGDNVLPATNGTAVVWQDFTNNPHWGVFLYDLGQGPAGTVDPIIADPSYDQKNPAISGDYIVYENWSSGQADIYLYFGANRTAVQVSRFDNNDLNPSVDGTRVVWQRQNTTTGFQAVYVYDMVTELTYQLTPPGSLFDQVSPEISGDRVVVEDYRGPGPREIYLYSLLTIPPTETWVTPGSPMAEGEPAISGSRIVWEDYRSGMGTSDIYLLTLGPAEVCPVADFTLTPPALLQGNPVTFTAAGHQAGTSAISHRWWNFSDGSPWVSAPSGTVIHGYAQDAVFPVRLTVGNEKCRNVSIDSCSHRVFVNSPPQADFDAVPEYGLAPLRVQFTDRSCGTPLNWSWDFGDGNISQEQNPGNLFGIPARDFTVTLTVNNTHAGYAPSVRTKTIRTFMGAEGRAVTPVEGIIVDSRYGGQFLTYDSSVLPAHAPAPPAPYLAVFPPAGSGWENITFIAPVPPGVGPSSPNQTYFANVSRFYLRTQDIRSITSGTPPLIGNNWGASYLVTTTRYPQASIVSIAIWEGAVRQDINDFEYISSHAIVPGLLRDIAYTVKITRPAFPGQGSSLINMSVGSDWVSTAQNIYVIGTGYDAAGNRVGAILPAEHRFSSGGLEYYEAAIPEQANFVSTFALADLTGSGNPFQLITLSLANIIDPPVPVEPASISENGDSPAVTDAGAARTAAFISSTTVTATPVLTPTGDPGISAKVYTNANGVVTQAARLESTDGRATLTLLPGTMAKDADGNPLTRITLRALPPGSIPELPSGSLLTFAGMSYEIGPDGATFSPPASLEFTLSQASWAQDYSVKQFDRASGTWQDLPASFSPATGTVTADVSHLCIVALFSGAGEPSATTPKTIVPVPSAEQAKAQPPTTAVNIFTNMLGWAAGLIGENILMVIFIVIAAAAAYVYRQGQWPG
jgi:beta propeller repeat protein